jgi:hypothetical protein
MIADEHVTGTNRLRRQDTWNMGPKFRETSPSAAVYGQRQLARIVAASQVSICSAYRSL